jgi:dolichol-phosphate mannosyltransferase
VRTKREEHPVSKFFAIATYWLISMFTDTNIPTEVLSNIDFFLISRRLVEATRHFKETNTSLFGLIIWLGFKQDFVRYSRRTRRTEKSKWDLRSKIRAAISWIVAFSGIPLKLISLLGFLTAALGFAYALFIIVYASLGYAPPGWSEPVILILVLGGIQMVMLGLMGEYLWRNLDESRKRPLYFIEDMTE